MTLPLKAVAAVLLTAGITPAGRAASGVMIGVALLVLGVTGWVSRLARLVPQSVLAERLLGLGAMAQISARRKGRPGEDRLWRMLEWKPIKLVAITLATRTPGIRLSAAIRALSSRGRRPRPVGASVTSSRPA